MTTPPPTSYSGATLIVTVNILRQQPIGFDHKALDNNYMIQYIILPIEYSTVTTFDIFCQLSFKYSKNIVGPTW